MNSSNNVKIKAIFVYSNDDIETSIFIGGHLVVILDEELIDPSYDLDLLDMFRAVRILNAELRHKKITFACSFKNTKFYIIGLLTYIYW